MRTRSGAVRGLVLAVALGVAGVAAGCGDASGCDDFDPGGPSLEVGETRRVEIGTTDRGGWEGLEVGDAYWTSDEGLPPGHEPGTPVTGEATRLAFDRLQLDVDGHTVAFGAIGCE